MQTGSKKAAWVWIISGIALLVYGGFIISDINVPGVETLVSFIDSLEDAYVYGSAFLIALIEGLYVVGNFFPGGTLIVIVALLSQSGGVSLFIMTILGIFLGWSLAGVINVYMAVLYKEQFAKHIKDGQGESQIQDQLLITWYPAFRANHEVENVVKGVSAKKVLLSSLKMKFYISLFAMGVALFIPLFIDVSEISDKEGVFALIVVAAISFFVGYRKLYSIEK